MSRIRRKATTLGKKGQAKKPEEEPSWRKDHRKLGGGGGGGGDPKEPYSRPWVEHAPER